MNKKSIILVIILVLALIFTGCNSATDNGDDAANTADAKTETAQATDTTEPTDTPEPTATPEPEIEYPTEFNSGDVLSFPNDIEVIFIGTEFTEKVSPSNPDTFASAYKVGDEKNIYLDVMVYVKNLQGKSFNLDDAIDFKLVYDGKYNYDGFSVIEEADGSDLESAYISYLSPLMTAKMHFPIEVPLEVRDSGKEYAIIMEVYGEEYQFTGEEGTGEVVQMAKEKELMSNESWQSFEDNAIDSMVVDEDYAEVTLKSTEFKTKVVPPSASGFYSYYEVKDTANVYLDVVVEFKNLMTDAKAADELMDVSAIYDNTYKFTAFRTVEADDGEDFDYAMSTYIDPLTSRTMHYVIEMPLEITESGKPLAVVFEFNGKEYKYELS